MMTHALLHAVVRPRAVVWFMTAADGHLLGAGEAADLSALRGVQIRAGIVEVICAGLDGPVPHADWRRAGKADQVALEALAARAGYRFPGPSAA